MYPKGLSTSNPEPSYWAYVPSPRVLAGSALTAAALGTAVLLLAPAAIPVASLVALGVTTKVVILGATTTSAVATLALPKKAPTPLQPYELIAVQDEHLTDPKL